MNRVQKLASIGVLAMLVACGGGGGGDENPTNPPPPTPAPEPPPPPPPPQPPQQIAPAITLQPQSQRVTVGTAVAFTAGASGTDPKQYQWLRNGQEIVAVSDTYVLSDPQLTDNDARFAVRVSNAAGSVTSEDAVLTVEAVSLPASMSLLAGNSAAMQYPDLESRDGLGAEAGFNRIVDMAVDAGGTLYVADHLAVRKVAPNGAVTTLAGGPTSGTADGQGVNARFQYLSGITVDATGHVYVADASGLRKITPEGVVTTMILPQLNGPRGIAADGNGSIYVVDSATIEGSSGMIIRKVAPDGTVSNVPGGEFPRSSSAFLKIGKITLDAASNIYLTVSTVRFGFCITGYCSMEVLNGHVLKIATDGTRSVIASTADAQPGALDGSAPSALFNYPIGIASTADGTLYVADSLNNAVRKIVAGNVGTVVGVLPEPDAAIYNPSPIVQGPLPGRLRWPTALALDGNGNLFVSVGYPVNSNPIDRFGVAIFKVSPRP